MKAEPAQKTIAQRHEELDEKLTVLRLDITRTRREYNEAVEACKHVAAVDYPAALDALRSAERKVDALRLEKNRLDAEFQTTIEEWAPLDAQLKRAT